MSIASIQQDARKLEPGDLVELFTIDLTKRGGDIYYFHPYTRLDGNVLVWQGHTFQPFPIKGEGWTWNAQGTQPRPIITVSNIESTITSLLPAYKDFVGCTIKRQLTYTRYLDVNPDGTTNANANPLEEFTPDVFLVERKVLEIPGITVQFELALPADVERVMLPHRQITAGYCSWDYRGPECGYIGPPIADVDNMPLNVGPDRGEYNPATTYDEKDYVWVLAAGVRVYYVSLVGSNTNPLTDKDSWTREACSKKEKACKLRFSPDPLVPQPLPYGGFPGCSKIPHG